MFLSTEDWRHGSLLIYMKGEFAMGMGLYEQIVRMRNVKFALPS